MRRILFRAKHHGAFVYGDLIHDYGSQGDSIRQGAEYGEHGIFAVDPSTIGEFTGLTDKNGKEIFEGDIVCDETGGVGVVDYSDGAYVIEYEKPIMPEWTGTLLYVEEPKELIVIGSIHDAVGKEGSDGKG